MGRVGTASRHSCIEVGAAPRAALVPWVGRRLPAPPFAGGDPNHIQLNGGLREPALPETTTPIPRIRINDARSQGNRVIVMYYETAYPGLLVDRRNCRLAGAAADEGRGRDDPGGGEGV